MQKFLLSLLRRLVVRPIGKLLYWFRYVLIFLAGGACLWGAIQYDIHYCYSYNSKVALARELPFKKGTKNFVASVNADGKLFTIKRIAKEKYLLNYTSPYVLDRAQSYVEGRPCQIKVINFGSWLMGQISCDTGLNQEAIEIRPIVNW